jgi:hypothetical protein
MRMRARVHYASGWHKTFRKFHYVIVLSLLREIDKNVHASLFPRSTADYRLIASHFLQIFNIFRTISLRMIDISISRLARTFIATIRISAVIRYMISRM